MFDRLHFMISRTMSPQKSKDGRFDNSQKPLNNESGKSKAGNSLFSKFAKAKFNPSKLLNKKGSYNVDSSKLDKVFGDSTQPTYKKLQQTSCSLQRATSEDSGIGTVSDGTDSDGTVSDARSHNPSISELDDVFGSSLHAFVVEDAVSVDSNADGSVFSGLSQGSSLHASVVGDTASVGSNPAGSVSSEDNVSVYSADASVVEEDRVSYNGSVSSGLSQGSSLPTSVVEDNVSEGSSADESISSEDGVSKDFWDLLNKLPKDVCSKFYSMPYRVRVSSDTGNLTEDNAFKDFMSHAASYHSSIL